MSRRATFARDVALFNFRSMVKPLHKSNLTRIFSRTESHTRLLSAHNHLRRVDLLNLAVLIRPDLKIRRGSLILKINRLIGILYQQLVLAVALAEALASFLDCVSSTFLGASEPSLA